MPKKVVNEELELKKSKEMVDKFVDYLKKLKLKKIYNDPNTKRLSFVYDSDQNLSSEVLGISSVKIKLQNSETYMGLITNSMYSATEKELHLNFKSESFIKENKEAFENKVFDSFLQYIKDSKKAVKVIKEEDPTNASLRAFISDKEVIRQLAAQFGFSDFDNNKN